MFQLCRLFGIGFCGKFGITNPQTHILMTEIEDIDFNSLVEDTEPEGRIRSMKVFDGKEYYVTIRLTDIVGSSIMNVEDEDTGKTIMGVFIPIRMGGLTLTPKKNVLLVAKCELPQLPSSRYTHLLSQICDKDVWAERRRLGFKEGFIGHMSPSGFKKKKK
jgi:hypothetical protein